MNIILNDRQKEELLYNFGNPHRLQMLAYRKQFENPNGDSEISKKKIKKAQYLQYLETSGYQLSWFQQQAVLGLLLSDASFQWNEKKDSIRLKLLQSRQHLDFLVHCSIVVNELCTKPNCVYQPSAKKRPNAFEFQTFMNSYFNQLAELTYSKVKNKTGNVPKALSSTLVNELSPVAIAYWFAGDGGKVSTGYQLEFATHAFTREECDLLVNTLINLGLKTAYTEVQKKEKNQSVVKLRGSDFDTFVEIVGPYLHPSMHSKLPEPRKDTSIYGKANKDFCDLWLGRAFKEQAFEKAKPTSW